jgi:hypothetical protein
MKRFILLSLGGLLIASSCGVGQTTKPTATPTALATEIPCPGVKPRGLSTGGQAYVTIMGNTVSVPLYENQGDTQRSGLVPHHMRVNLEEGPICAQQTAWWRISLPNGEKGWLEIGSGLNGGEDKYDAILEPFIDDAVQREVPDNRKREAQVRYIIADIEMGGPDVLKYYQEQAAAKPDDPETELIKTAIEIINAGGVKPVVANAAAFERKPLRGGTSVVDAGTEFVQPGLDILLSPCDGTDPKLPVCEKLLK